MPYDDMQNVNQSEFKLYDQKRHQPMLKVKSSLTFVTVKKLESIKALELESSNNTNDKPFKDIANL